LVISEKDKSILGVIKEKKYFLRSDVTLEGLAASIGSSSKALTAIIKASTGKSFSDFINTLRLEFFLKLVDKGELKHKTIFALAQESGFKSKSTFNRVFKRNYGKTPSEFIKDLDH
jgi:AraC-like DNA-binding protein